MHNLIKSYDAVKIKGESILYPMSLFINIKSEASISFFNAFGLYCINLLDDLTVSAYTAIQSSLYYAIVHSSDVLIRSNSFEFDCYIYVLQALYDSKDITVILKPCLNKNNCTTFLEISLETNDYKDERETIC